MGEQVLCKEALDEKGVAHITAIRKGNELHLQVTARNRLLAHMSLPMTYSTAKFFRDRATIMEHQVSRDEEAQRDVSR